MADVPQQGVLDDAAMSALAAWLDERRRSLVDDLRAYAEHETPSDDVDLLRKGLDHLEGWLGARLGDPVDRAVHESQDYGDVVVLDYPGSGPHRLTLLCHYDTVWSAGTLGEWPVREDGDEMSGPGVFDMKAGLVQAVWALRALDSAGVSRPAVRLVLTGDEEIGSPFSRPLIERACADASAVLVFEASADGAVKTSRKGVGLFAVEVAGVESHAGLEPEAGASAIDEIARVVRTVHDATDRDAGHFCQRRGRRGRHQVQRGGRHRPGEHGRTRADRCRAGAHRRCVRFAAAARPTRDDPGQRRVEPPGDAGQRRHRVGVRTRA